MTKTNHKYDYIVIGSGPGGCAVSQTLLSTKNKVLMIEAGEDKDSNELIYDSTNALGLEEDHYPEFFWITQQVVQENVDIPTANYSNGRCFGGGSSVNGLQYVRGSSNVFQKWFEITHDRDWHPNNVFRTYRKFEKLNAVSSEQLLLEGLTQGDSQGFDGSVHIRQAPEIPTEAAKKFVDAAVSVLGFDEIADYNDPSKPFGPFTRWQYYQKNNGNRESSSTAILKPLLMPNRRFSMLSSATVLRVIFNGKIAIGVEYMKNYKVEQVYATKGVILSAGIQTPIILQRSGVGDKDRLTELGVPVVSNLPNVGENLANHLLLSTLFTKDSNDLPSDDANALYSFGAFYPQPSNQNLDAPRGSEWIGLDMGLSMMIAILQADPFSRGYARIQSKDPLTTVLASEAALDDDRDLTFFKDVIRNQILPLADQLTADSNGTYTLVEPDPNSCYDEDYIENYIRTHLDHAHHWQSQCIMAPRDQGGVVDSSGKVYGTRNLYIADNCIVPYTVDGNTAGVAYMIGYTIGKKINRVEKRKRKQRH